MEHITGVIMMAWIYLTPIMYSVEMIPEKLRGLFNFNPMTPVVQTYQKILYYRELPNAGTFVYAVILAIVILFIGSIVFKKLEKNFAEEL